MFFNDDGTLPPLDYELTISELKESILVKGTQNGEPWDSTRRAWLVKNLETLVKELWQVGITEIFIDGSFVENKASPGDIDGYFIVENPSELSRIISQLNDINEHKIWTWDPDERTHARNSTKKQLPMWHQYRVELYIHIPRIGNSSGIPDEHGNELQFPAAFRQTRDTFLPKGIVKIKKNEEED